MSYDDILLDLEDGIATITMNRPDKLNAYTADMGEEITLSLIHISEPTRRM